MTYEQLVNLAHKEASSKPPVSERAKELLGKLTPKKAGERNRMTCSEYIKSKNLLGKFAVKEAKKEASERPSCSTRLAQILGR